MVRALGKPLTQDELDDGPEIVIAERLAPIFADQGPKYRPEYPEDLARIIGHSAGYPTGEFPLDINEKYHLDKDIDKRVEDLIDDCRSIRRSLSPHSDDAALYRILLERFPKGYADHIGDYYIEVGKALRILSNAPALQPRSPPVGKRRRDPYAVEIAQSICWYLFHCEGLEPTIGRARGGSSTSKAGVLLGIVLQVLDNPLRGQLASVLETAIESGSWRQPAAGPWSLIPTTRRPAK